MMDLGQVRSFAEVAERGTVAAAAAAEGFTAPAVSQHIAKLEAELGTQLFDRAGRRLRLTEAGEALLPVALQLLELEARGRQVVEDPTRTPHYVIAGFASAISTLVVPKLAALGGRMVLEIVESEDIESMRDLSLGTVDVVLTQEYQGLPSERNPRFSFTPIVTDQLRLVLPAEMSPRTTVEQLADTDWLVNGRGTRCAMATIEILRTAGIQPTISGTVADNETLLALVAAGHGVTVVPGSLLWNPHPQVTVADQELGVERTIFAVSRTISTDSIAPLIDVLRPSPR